MPSCIQTSKVFDAAQKMLHGTEELVRIYFDFAISNNDPLAFWR